MAFVTKVLLFLLLSPLFAHNGNLDELWRQKKWNDWISTAANQGIQSSEAYFNLASTSWEAEDSTGAVKNLLIASQLRNNPFKAWSDLSLLSQIQAILFAQPSPIDSYRMRFFLIWNKSLQVVWACLLLWVILIGVFLRWGWPQTRFWDRPLLFIFIFLTTVGGLLFFNEKNISYPSYLAKSNQLIPVYKEFDSNPEEPLLELPSGIMVLTGDSKNNRVFIEEPVKAWIDQTQLEPFPTVN
jgi:hypothetical protein